MARSKISRKSPRSANENLLGIEFGSAAVRANQGSIPVHELIKMALPFETTSDPHDPRAVRILAKSIYRELRATGFSERDVMSLAGELLALVTSDVRGQGPSSEGR